MESKKQKIGRYSYVAEPFHVDFSGKLSWSVLGNNLLNSAEFHSTDRGFGIARLNKDNYTWVLSRLAIEVSELPKQFESYTIETWVENVYRLFTDRNYALYNSDKRCIGYARSIWAMINFKTRKPANLIELHGDDINSYKVDQACPIEKPTRIKVKSQEAVSKVQTKYTDIDINGHVNSVRYIDYILNLFTLEKYANYRVKRFEIAYVTESYFNDVLCLFIDENSEKEYAVEVRKESGEIVCRSKIEFEILEKDSHIK